MNARRGIYVAPFDELSEPRVVAELAARAEERGWDGFFVWDHLKYRAPVTEGGRIRGSRWPRWPWPPNAC